MQQKFHPRTIVPTYPRGIRSAVTSEFHRAGRAGTAGREKQIIGWLQASLFELRPDKPPDKIKLKKLSLCRAIADITSACSAISAVKSVLFLFTAEIAESAEKNKLSAGSARKTLRLIIIVVNDSFYPFCQHANIEIDQ